MFIIILALLGSLVAVENKTLWSGVRSNWGFSLEFQSLLTFTVAILQVVFMVVLFSRTQEMEDEMALELRHSDKKYVHSYA